MTNRQREKAVKAAYVEAAIELRGRDGGCEIAGNAKVSMGGDPGAYVQAWVWVPDHKMAQYLPEELRIGAEFAGGEE